MFVSTQVPFLKAYVLNMMLTNGLQSVSLYSIKAYYHFFQENLHFDSTV